MGKEKIIAEFEYKEYKSEVWINHKDRDRYYGNVYTPADYTKPYAIADWGVMKYAGDSLEKARKQFEWQVEMLIEQEQERKRQEEWESVTDYISVGQVCAIHPRKFEQRVKEGKFDKNLLTAVKGGVYAVPIYYITKAWDVLLKGSLPNAYMIGCEEDDDYTEEDVREFNEENGVTRTRAEASQDNDRMKEIWKEYFGIDVDALDVDFRVFDMHLEPNVSEDEYRYYFGDVPNGIYEWILGHINYSEEDSEAKVSYDFAAALMEYTADVLQYRDECADCESFYDTKISPERHEGPTENGGAYSLVYYYNHQSLPCQKEEAAMMEIVEFTEDGRYLKGTFKLVSKEII